MEINDLYLAVQGEGANTGVPMVLVRFHGCPVGCPWCDTRETWKALPQHQMPTVEKAAAKPENWVRLTPVQVVQAIKDLGGPNLKWVMVTGGEPCVQPELFDFIDLLLTNHYKVALETSGHYKTRLPRAAAGHLWVTVSPKGTAVRPDMLCRANEIKLVVHGTEETVLKTLDDYGINETLRGKLCLQPNSTRTEAAALATDLCLKYGWRLSIQVHKLMGLK